MHGRARWLLDCAGGDGVGSGSGVATADAEQRHQRESEQRRTRAGHDLVIPAGRVGIIGIPIEEQESGVTLIPGSIQQDPSPLPSPRLQGKGEKEGASQE